MRAHYLRWDASRLNVVFSLLLWSILLAAIVGSIRPLTPITYNDTPAFVNAALHMLETWRPAVVDGRDPGYPMVLAMNFSVGGSLRSVVLFQYLAWAILMIALAATSQIVTRASYSLVPIILLAMYPGLLIYRNSILSETLYMFFLNMAVLGVLLATSIRSPIMRCWMVSAAIIMAAVAACFKSQGILVPIVVISLGAWITWPLTSRRLAVMLLSCAIALAVLATSSRFGVSPADEWSAQFVEKTVFCNHLNIVLESEAAKREIATAAGDRADAMLSRLAADLVLRKEGWPTWPTLGFYGDFCTYGLALDQYLARDDVNSARPVVAAFYRRIFLVAILDRPLSYIGKIVRQLHYGAWFSWPPHGLGGTSQTSDTPISEMLKQHGIRTDEIEEGDSIKTWILSDLGLAGVLLFRGLSAAFVTAMLFWILVAVSGRQPTFSLRAGIVIVLWVASILPTAASITLDMWRYLVPSTPMVALLLSMVFVQLPETLAAYRRTLSLTWKSLS
jgi:hypothetical protein